MRALIQYIRTTLIHEREELFVEGDSVYVSLAHPDGLGSLC